MRLIWKTDILFHIPSCQGGNKYRVAKRSEIGVRLRVHPDIFRRNVCNQRALASGGLRTPARQPPSISLRSLRSLRLKFFRRLTQPRSSRSKGLSTFKDCWRLPPHAFHQMITSRSFSAPPREIFILRSLRSSPRVNTRGSPIAYCLLPTAYCLICLIAS